MLAMREESTTMTANGRRNSRAESGSQPVRMGAICLLGVAFAVSLMSSSATMAADGFTTGSSDVIIEFINEKIRQGWEDNEISPSEVAEDGEWCRRVYLDLIGRIPSSDELAEFVKDDDSAKRTKLIDSLLDTEDYVRNWTTIWTNLLIGRETPRRTSRPGMERFLREAFAKNRRWDEVVGDLITAEGRFDENGAVNYLLSQMTMRDEAVQATAKTTRLFMGIQVQCTQCHNHPFNDWKQDQFWEFNSFFRQVRRVDHRKPNAQGRLVDDYSELLPAVFFEKRSGLMQVAYPKFFDAVVDPGDGVDRRAQFAKLMVAGDNPYIAQAMVNRMWGHFFGFGFTRPIDDMGPHNPATHPELLDRLSREFVKSGYNLKELMRWITNSEAYNLTSQFGRKTTIDYPSAGEIPILSRMYMKGMEAAQLYDSLILATNAHKSGRSSWEQAQAQRQQWLQQFVITFGTDENDEATTFNGTIPQALMMMNGPLIQSAISVEQGGYLREVLASPSSDAEKIQHLYLSTLGRHPSRKEASTALKLVRSNRANPIAGYQDLFWALLNSNEFIFVH